MEQQTADESDDVAARIDETVETMDKRREDEEQRHEEAMERIKSDRADALDTLATEGGLDAITERHDELSEVYEEIHDLRDRVRTRILGLLNDRIEGGFDRTITFRDGGVYRYNKRKNARIPFHRLVSGRYRDTLDEAIDAHFEPDVADEMKLALDTIDTRTDGGTIPTYRAEGDINITAETEHFNRTHEEEYDILAVGYKSPRSNRSNPTYIRLEEDAEFSPDSTVFKPTTRSPWEMKILLPVRDDVLDLMDTIEGQMEDDRDGWREVAERVDSALPYPHAEEDA